jgi:putative flippase GtrA
MTLKRTLLAKSDRTLIQLIRYGFVGGGAYAVDFGALYLLTDHLHLHYLLSAAIGFLLGLITNYALSVAWVFHTRSVGDRRKEFLIFAVIGAVGLGFNELFIWFFTETAGLHYLVSKLISTVAVFFWNFYARKKILFS